jgi:hypothetical protein
MAGCSCGVVVLVGYRIGERVVSSLPCRRYRRREEEGKKRRQAKLPDLWIP